MLMPKRTKYRRVQRGRMKGAASRGNKVSYGEFGIQALEAHWITNRQIEAARIAMTRYMKRGGRVYITIFPDKPITKKPAETRMGSGKGNPEEWVAVVKPGRIMFEVKGVPEEVAREALRLAQHKLPIKTKIVAAKNAEQRIEKEMAEEVAQIKAAGGKIPHLAAILVGHDGGSETYVASKVKTCQEIGFKSTLIRFEEDVTEEELLRKVDELNNDPDVDGFIVQLPLPKHISEQKVIEAIDYRKDVDGFHPINVGRMSIGLPCFVSATPAGILELLKRYHIETQGKHCVVLGRSNIVGKPMATLMMQKSYPGDCTVTVCHSRSKNLKEMCLSADIIIVALGVPEFLKGDMVKEGAVIVDVGTTRMPSSITKSGFKLTGDVLFNEVAPKCSYITPVPGGVGPMTIISLMRNTLLAGKKAIYK